MNQEFIITNRIQNGISYETYFEKMKQDSERTATMTEEVSKHNDSEKLKLNFQRMQRITKTYSVDSELISIVQQINKPQMWIVLTETWCGDSAQILPFIAKIAGYNPFINLKILFRDENLDIMDMYLYEGQFRSIPKLIAFNKEGAELFQWGPRPAKAIELISNLKSEGKTKDEFITQLHLWYARNRGQAIEIELKNILSTLI